MKLIYHIVINHTRQDNIFVFLYYEKDVHLVSSSQMKIYWFDQLETRPNVC